MNYLCCLFCTCMSYFLVNACCNRSFESSNDLSSENLIKHNFDSVIETYKQNDEDVIICPITQEQILIGETVKKLPCGHKFSENVNKWIYSNDWCPVCRKKIMDIV